MGTERYIWDEQTDNVINRINADSSIDEYLFHPVKFGAMLGARTASREEYFHCDASGSVRGISGSGSTVFYSAVYSAFGEAVATTGSTTAPFKFLGESGYVTSDDGGPIYVRTRNLSTEWGRWLTADPLGHVDGLNLYCYAFNNPINLRDPSGWAVSITVQTLEDTPTAQSFSCARSKAKAYFRFMLTTNPCTGWLIQKVDVSCKVSHCKEKGPCCEKKLGEGGGIDEKVSYYEAWRIPKPRRIAPESGKIEGFRVSDIAFYKPYDKGINDEHGFYEQKTELKYFCEEDRMIDKVMKTGIGDLRTSGEDEWGPWERNVVHAGGQGTCSSTTSGSLLSGDAQKFFNDPQYVVAELQNARLFRLEWFCCQACPKNMPRAGVKLIVEPEPEPPKKKR